MTRVEVANLAVVSVLLLCVFALGELLRARRAAPESTRKLVHVLGGLVAASFPWLFSSPWTVVALTASFFGLLIGTRNAGLLQSVHGVDRRTDGGLYYPAAVGLTFAIAHDRPEAYVPAILVLAVADAAAALIGRDWGLTRYTLAGATRSLEGSGAFFVCALACVHLPLAALTALPPLELCLWSVHVAVLATFVEALAPEGSDNLAIPLLTCLVLLEVDGGAAPHEGLWLLLLGAGTAVGLLARREPQAGVRLR